MPNVKARSLSPQQLFDSDVQGHYGGDGNSFRLFLNNNTPLIVEYDECNSFPIAYAQIGASPQLILALYNENNQNLTGGQKILLH